MGGFNTYPALDIKQPEGPLQQMGQVMQLKALQGQIAQQPGQLALQQQQIQAQKNQLNDKAAETAAMKEWAEAQGKIPMEALPDLITKHGGSADARLAMNQKLMAQQQSIQALTKEKRENAMASNSAVAAAAQDVLSLPAELQPQAYAQKQKELLAAGHIDAQHAQIPYDSDNLKILAAGSAHLKDALELEDKKQTAAAAMLNAKAREAQANKPPAEQVEMEGYTKDYLGSKNLPDTATNRLLARQQYFKDKQPFGAQKIQIEQQRADTAETAAGRKDTDFIDKTYVKPANDTEKSYQMFQNAYNNRNDAKTGAESMLALSTHLATTFGNVKGSRITKDMIQEHLGARGVGDKALVAVQSLVNGDRLSPDQWDAFKGLISESRNLSWQTVQKEAKRRGVDVSGSLPDDIKNPAANKADPLGIR